MLATAMHLIIIDLHNNYYVYVYIYIYYTYINIYTYIDIYRYRKHLQTRTLVVRTAKHMPTMLMMTTLRWKTRFRQASRGTGLRALCIGRVVW